jgi:propanediol dehydratase small subunit
MTATCKKAIQSIRIIARTNLRQARAAKQAGRPRMAAYHLDVCLSCRRDANALRSTAKS